jgi:hypothetical protein
VEQSEKSCSEKKMKGATTKPPMMQGGAKKYLLDIVDKFHHPIQLYVLVALALGIAYVKEIPIEIRSQAGAPLGRIFLFVSTVLITHYFSWVNGLLFAVLSLLLMSLSPRVEGFQPIDDSISLITNKKKWFVEEVLKETPVAIEKEKVRTLPVQDNSTSQASISAQGGSK